MEEGIADWEQRCQRPAERHYDVVAEAVLHLSHLARLRGTPSHSLNGEPDLSYVERVCTEMAKR
ncbi:MAG: hypothetical protein U5K74_08860 [Gemmatimonadaceae bacterium]|nr:hypothetical protein [Gemmatimonadaceae bacterium]